MIVDDQLFLLSCAFAARADSADLIRLVPQFQASEDFFNAVCVLWPELDDPLHLEFLFSTEISSKIDTSDLLVSLIETDGKLISVAEMDNITVEERCRTIKQYASDRLKMIEDCDKFKFNAFEAKWMRKRIVLCNDFNPEHTTLYKPIWKKVIQMDTEFARWINGIVAPLEHLNKRLARCMKIREFENMEPLEVLMMILKTQSNFHTTVITKELIPYLSGNRLYDMFTEEVFNSNNFGLNSVANYNVFKQLFTELTTSPASPQYIQRIKSQAAEIIFENSSNLLKVTTLNDFKSLLAQIEDAIQVGKYAITASTLKDYAKYMDTVFANYSLKDVYAITQEEESAQLAHFASIVKEQILQNDRNGRNINSIFELVDETETKGDKVFNRLSLDREVSVLIESALELGEFTLLQEFITRYDSTVEDKMLTKYFWHFFNKASNGLRTRPEIIKAEKTLELLLTKNNAKYKHLKDLLDVANDLSTYSINLGKGIPFKPSDILDFKDRPFDLISLLLELNNNLYKDLEKSCSLLQKLFRGLNLKCQNDDSFDEDFVRILVLHIDHSLANMDFQFALGKTRELLKRNGISQYWPTIFQVGKFIDPSWPDGEVPTEIIFLQLSILGDLLQICPVEEVEAVASQWSALELELVARDLIHDHYSLKNSEKSVQGNVIFNGVSNTFSNFLSGNS